MLRERVEVLDRHDEAQSLIIDATQWGRRNMTRPSTTLGLTGRCSNGRGVRGALQRSGQVSVFDLRRRQIQQHG
jgi:hypothetical protein